MTVLCVKVLSYIFLSNLLCGVAGGGQYRLGMKVEDGSGIMFERSAVLDMSCLPEDIQLPDSEELRSMFKLKLEKTMRELQSAETTSAQALLATTKLTTKITTGNPATMSTKQLTTATTQQTAIQPTVCGDPNLAVYWSMDKYHGNTVFPDCGGEEWKFDFLSSEGSLQEGIVGKALQISKGGKPLELRRNVNSVCLHDLDKCTTGLSFVFWLKVKSWGTQKYKIILKTTNADRTLPGIFLGGDEGDENFIIFFRTGYTGVQYEASFPRSLITFDWIHMAVSWDRRDGIMVALNGTMLGADDGYISSHRDIDEGTPSLTDFEAGNAGGVEFLLDEFKVYYSCLTSAEIFHVSEGDHFELSMTPHPEHGFAGWHSGFAEGETERETT